MIENKKIEQDLREIDIRIKNLKTNRNYDFGKVAMYTLCSGAILTLNIIPDFNDIWMIPFTSGLSAFNICNGAATMANIGVTNEQIRNLKYLKNYLMLQDMSKISIDKLDRKIESIKKNDKNKSNLEFLKHYLENNSLSHDDMKYKKLVAKSK